MMTEQDVKGFIAEVAEEVRDQYGGSFREFCVGLECLLKDLHEKGTTVMRVRLDFRDGGFVATDLHLEEKPPKDYAVEGVWAVIYSCVMPRYTPFGDDPLKVASLEIGYGMDPIVRYDHLPDNGLPMGLNRKYDPSKVAKSKEARK